MTLTLTAMRGYPGSGKSTRARELAGITGAVVVCRDNLRMMLHGMYHSGKKELEEQVTVAERAQVAALLKSGVSVIVDATHLEASYLRKWAKMAALYGAAFIRYDVPTDVEKCIDQDWVRKTTDPSKHVGEEVIRRMAKRHPMSDWPNIQAPPTVPIEAVKWNPALREAVIVDIDGTLAHMTGRSPYDYSQVHTDVVDDHVRWLVNRLWGYFPPGSDIEILIVSGRDDECRESTEKWLRENGIAFDALYMRPTGAVDNHGNKLPDYVVKHDLFNQHIRGKYNVRFVLDDRDQVVNLWRQLGLKCLQVQPGDF